MRFDPSLIILIAVIFIALMIGYAKSPEFAKEVDNHLAKSGLSEKK
jgi:hypothetical protein